MTQAVTQEKYPVNYCGCPMCGHLVRVREMSSKYYVADHYDIDTVDLNPTRCGAVGVEMIGTFKVENHSQYDFECFARQDIEYDQEKRAV